MQKRFCSGSLRPVEEPSLEVNKTAVALAATAGEATFNVTANNAWSAEADADWVSLDPASGAGVGVMTSGVRLTRQPPLMRAGFDLLALGFAALSAVND